jgi:hypothetical protein
VGLRGWSQRGPPLSGGYSEGNLSMYNVSLFRIVTMTPPLQRIYPNKDGKKFIIKLVSSTRSDIFNAHKNFKLLFWKSQQWTINVSSSCGARKLTQSKDWVLPFLALFWENVCREMCLEKQSMGSTWFRKESYFLPLYSGFLIGTHRIIVMWLWFARTFLEHCWLFFFFLSPCVPISYRIKCCTQVPSGKGLTLPVTCSALFG